MYFNYLLKTSEIILKRKNRFYFERILIENIKKKLGENLIFLKNLGAVFWLQTKKDVDGDLKKIFGITLFLKTEIFNDLNLVINFLKERIKERKIKKVNLEVKRGDKNYILNSLEIKKKIEKELAQINLEKEQVLLNKSTDKDEPEEKIYIEYRDGKFFVGLEKIYGFGGLPVGSSGKGLVLLSSGFDSPVASFLTMKRGLKLNFLHFHSYPQTSLDSIEKVKRLVNVLNEYNLGRGSILNQIKYDSGLYLTNILEIQKFYFQNIPHKFLVIFYRRTMYRLAEKLAQELKIDCLITGENLGQVASQTIQNLKVIEQAVNTLVLRPLVSFNKQEIIDLAKKIGTEEISKLKVDDCCTLFIPRNVKTKAKLEEVLGIENKIKNQIVELEEKIYNEKEIIKF